jgi:thiamine biosynthesis lipoprotein
VITSGGYERYFEQDGVTYHHILDPKTGKPSDSDLISVTIVSKDGMRADCLSTTLFVLGKDKAVSYWKEHSEEFDCILVDEDNSIYVTEGIEDHFTSDYEYQLIKK